jgi:hypothetical protein
MAGITSDDVPPEIAAALDLPTLESITAELLDTCRDWVRCYVILSADQAVILAAWILHTWAFEASEITPYIHITAPEKACGKSRLMDVLAAIASKPAQSSGMTAPALVRCLDRDAPTIFLDEVDTQVAGNKEIGEAIRGILNAGFQRGGKFSKCDGPQHKLRDFNVYSPKCHAGIGHIWDTVSSRSIAIEMRRKLPGESVEPFRRRDVNTAALPIRQQLEAWSQTETLDRLLPMRPAAIQGISDRQNDMAEPLLAIAELAGSEWRGSLTDALRSVFSSQASEDVSVPVMLLSDIRDAFEDKKIGRITSVDLVEYLTAIEERPWAEWNRGKPMTASQIARQLKKHGIRPKSIRLGGEVQKGYQREDFAEAWSRYCPLSPTPENAVTRLHPSSSLTKSENSSGHIAVTPADTNANGAVISSSARPIPNPVPGYAAVTAPASTVTAQNSLFHLDRDDSNSHEQRSVTALPFVTANRGDEQMDDSEVRV